MKSIVLFAIALLCLSCSDHVDWEQRRTQWKPFSDHEIQWKMADYKKSPFARQMIKHKGEASLAYMDSLEFYGVAFENDGLLITGFLIQPKKAKNTPVIVFHRGGNRNLGLVKMNMMMGPLSKYALSGYSVIAINYRGNIASEGADEFGGKDVDDLVYLLESLHSLPGIDTSKVGLLGISRGGMMIYQLLKRKVNAKAVAVIGGMTDLVRNLSFHDGMDQVYEDLVPRYDKNPVEELKKRSAFYWADQLKPIPLQVFHGTKDTHVSVEETRLFIEKLEKNNYPVEYHEYDDNHGISANKEQVFQKIVRHFDQYLK